MARIVLSALAETRRLAEGLNLRAVGGNEWAARILRSGWISAWRHLYRNIKLTASVLASRIPIDRSEHPYANKDPSELRISLYVWIATR